MSRYRVIVDLDISDDKMKTIDPQSDNPKILIETELGWTTAKSFDNINVLSADLLGDEHPNK